MMFVHTKRYSLAYSVVLETEHIYEYSRSGLKFMCNFLSVVSGNGAICAIPMQESYPSKNCLLYCSLNFMYYYFTSPP